MKFYSSSSPVPGRAKARGLFSISMLLFSLILVLLPGTTLKGQYDPIVISGDNPCVPAGTYPFFAEFDKPMFANLNTGINIFWDSNIAAWTVSFGSTIYFQINEDTPLPPCGEWTDVADCGGTFSVSGGCTELSPAVCPPSGDTWYVSAAAAPGGDGTSWDCAFQDLQDALSMASAGQEIWVAEGVYVPGDARNSSFVLKDEVAIYGGFPVNGNPGEQDRDYEAYPTILSGEIGTPDSTDNVLSVVVGTAGLTTATVLDGFIIEDGHSNNFPNRRYGGGLFLSVTGNDVLCEPTIRNCTFRNNFADTGAAICVRINGSASSSPTFENCNIYNNMGTFGHSAWLGNNCFATFEGCNFDNNSGRTGLNVNTGYSNFNNCTFTNNSANSNGAALWVRGSVTISNCTFEGNNANDGSLRLQSDNITVTNCTFTNNSASGGGGAIFALACSPLIEDCVFSQNNSSGSGGAVFNQDASPRFLNCKFIGNAAQNGGAVLNNGNGNRVARPTMINCLFDANTASSQGGAILNQSNAGQDAVPELINCTLYGNSAGNLGDAIYNFDGGSAKLRNTIVFNNGGPGAIEGNWATTIDATHSLFDAEVSGYSDAETNYIAENDPFMDAENGDFELNDCAAAIDRGDNAAYFGEMGPMEDLAGADRLHNASGGDEWTIDMGAFEFEGVPVPLVLSCKAMHEVVLDQSGQATLEAAVFDNGSTGCEPFAFELDGDASLDLDCSDIGTYTLTLQLTDARRETSSCSVSLTVTDETAPAPVCLNPTVTLDGNGMYTLQESDVFDAVNSTDNCGITQVSFEEATYTCPDVGQTFSVLVSARDAAGLESFCLSTVQVGSNDELPQGWSPTDIGDVGEGSTYSYDICGSEDPNQAGLAISTGGYNLIPRNSDNVAFVSLPLCGNGGIQARIDHVSNGYAGLMIRESSDPAAKMVAIYSAQSSLVRREFRATHGADKSTSLLFAPGHKWFRLIRSGNYIGGFYRTSSGGNWQLFFLAYLIMPDCVEMGLAAFTTDPNGTADVNFSNIRYRSNLGSNLSAPESMAFESWEPEVTKAVIAPNPVQDVFTLDFSRPLFADGTATLFNEFGQRVGQRALRQGTSAIDWQAGNLPAGLYFLEVMAEDGYREVLKVVRQ